MIVSNTRSWLCPRNKTICDKEEVYSMHWTNNNNNNNMQTKKEHKNNTTCPSLEIKRLVCNSWRYFCRIIWRTVHTYIIYERKKRQSAWWMYQNFLLTCYSYIPECVNLNSFIEPFKAVHYILNWPYH